MFISLNDVVAVSVSIIVSNDGMDRQELHDGLERVETEIRDGAKYVVALACFPTRPILENPTTTTQQQQHVMIVH
jgi:hypothetical protein